MRRVRRSIDSAEAARLLDKARALAGYLFIADPENRPANLDELTADRLRALASTRLSAPVRPMARQVLTVLDEIDPQHGR